MEHIMDLVICISGLLVGMGLIIFGLQYNWRRFKMTPEERKNDDLENKFIY